MISTSLSNACEPSYKYAEEGHSGDVVRDNRATYDAAVGDAGGTPGDDVGRGSRTNSFVGIVGILDRGFIGTDRSGVVFLRPAPALAADLTHSPTEAKGRCGVRGGLSLLITLY